MCIYPYSLQKAAARAPFAHDMTLHPNAFIADQNTDSFLL